MEIALYLVCDLWCDRLGHVPPQEIAFEANAKAAKDQMS
jgi:hypothetical protein